MFEEMRDAVLAGRAIGRADLVSEDLENDRRGMIGNDVDFETVLEREGFDGEKIGRSLVSETGGDQTKKSESRQKATGDQNSPSNKPLRRRWMTGTGPALGVPRA